jgi:hypothetical protein
MWTRWINYAHPYDGLMQEAVVPTLTGSQTAVLVAPHDDETGAPAKWRRVLYTARTETPDPEATIAAATTEKPAGVVLRHELTDARPTQPDLTSARALRIAALSRAFERAEVRTDEIRTDPRASPRAIEAALDECDRLRQLLLTDVEAAITTGLDARFGSRILPIAVLTPKCLTDHLLYRSARLIRSSLATWERQSATSNEGSASAARLAHAAQQDEWRPPHLAVCAHCTIVFRPRATARLCALCAHTKSSAPPLGYGHPPITKPGDRVRISVPQRHPRLDRLIIGYTDRTVGLCSECDTPFVAKRSDAGTCGRSACRMRRSRRCE